MGRDGDGDDDSVVAEGSERQKCASKICTLIPIIEAGFSMCTNTKSDLYQNARYLFCFFKVLHFLFTFSTHASGYIEF